MSGGDTRTPRVVGPVITPTVGRIVWYYPSEDDRINNKLGGDTKQPMAAQICYVWHDRMVNLSVTSHVGMVTPRANVLLLQGDAQYEPKQPYCTWMPYQVGQAKVAAEPQNFPNFPILPTMQQRQAAAAISDMSG